MVNPRFIANVWIVLRVLVDAGPAGMHSWELRTALDAEGYDASTRSAHIMHAKNLVKAGLATYGRDGKYRATPEGRRECERHAVWWRDQGKKAQRTFAKFAPEDYPEPGDVEQRSRREFQQRLPTATEADKLLRHAPPEFALLFNVARETRRNPYELATARIERIDWQQGALALEKTAISGAPIEERTVRFGDKAAALIKSAAGDRRRGAVFLDPGGKPWGKDRLAHVFRAARTKAKLPQAVVLTGYGAVAWREAGKEDA